MPTAGSCSRCSSAATRQGRCGRISWCGSGSLQIGSWPQCSSLQPRELRMQSNSRLRHMILTIALALAPASAFAIDAARLPRNLSPWGMFLGADVVVKTVMVGLAVASLVTWTVWLAKTIELRREGALALERTRALEGNMTLAEASARAGDVHDAVAQLIQSCAREAELSGGVLDDGLQERVALRLERVEAAMSRQIARGTGALATIGATAPLVGLSGTVWGIMNSFIGISESHTTNLAVVAPGIAEALLATALGLVAAIPAVVIYNHHTRTISAHRALLGDASAMVLLLISREGDRGSFRLARAAE